MKRKHNSHHTNDFITKCDNCGNSLYVHPPHNNFVNHIILAQRHSGIHKHPCSVYEQTTGVRVYISESSQ